MSHEYVLRERDDEEFSRLKFQHQVWKEETDFAVEKCKVNEGDKIIDLGCGPGYLSYDLLELIGDSGEIYCMDNSEKFIASIKKQKIKNIEPIRMDIRNDLLKYPQLIGKIDKAFCRWVLMFIGDVEKIINDIYTMLKPGGKFISMEYFNFQQISVFPQSESFDRIYQGVWKLIKQNGGNPDIGNDIYKMMSSAGFRNIEIFPLFKTGKVNSPAWKWLEQTNDNHQNLVKAGLIDQNDLERFYSDWEEKSGNEFSFITAPPFMITIGEK